MESSMTALSSIFFRFMRSRNAAAEKAFHALVKDEQRGKLVWCVGLERLAAPIHNFIRQAVIVRHVVLDEVARHDRECISVIQENAALLRDWLCRLVDVHEDF